MLILIPNIILGQKTIVVKEGDTSKMVYYPDNKVWNFKYNLPDGHYISYKNNDTNNMYLEISFKNGKKNGVERYCRIHVGENKYSEINWKDGKMNGIFQNFELIENKRIVSELRTYRNNVYDGLYFFQDNNNIESGYYKNGLRDSIWTYYDHFNEYSIDSSNSQISRVYKYIDKSVSLISAWNKNGEQTVINGNGIIVDSGVGTYKTKYLNGQKNGEAIAKYYNGDTAHILIYKNNFLIKETYYSELNYDGTQYSSYISSTSEWKYDSTMKIAFGNDPIDGFYGVANKNGNWVEYFPNGVKKYEGNYNNGERIGLWRWYYQSGILRITADYSKNIWHHYDSTGTFVSNLKEEFLTILTARIWWIKRTKPIGDSKLTLLSSSGEEPYFFEYDGSIINPFSDKIVIGYCSLIGDNLSLSILGKRYVSDDKYYQYKIVSDSDSKIKLKLLYKK